MFDISEGVEVNQHHGRRSGAVEHRLQPMLERVAVGEPGEGVGEGALQQFMARVVVGLTVGGRLGALDADRRALNSVELPLQLLWSEHLHPDQLPGRQSQAADGIGPPGDHVGEGVERAGAGGRHLQRIAVRIVEGAAVGAWLESVVKSC